jgi:hypothetical protein
MQHLGRPPTDTADPDLVVRLIVQTLLVVALLASALTGNVFVIMAATSAILVNTSTVLFRVLTTGWARPALEERIVRLEPQ